MRQREHCKSRRFYFFYEKGNENYKFGTGFFVHHRIDSAVNRVRFVSNRISLVTRGRWRNIVVLNAHDPSEEKNDSFYEELEKILDHFRKYHTKIVLGDINAKVEREDIFKPTIEYEILQHDSNGNGVRIVRFAASST